ncbi:unnamed protein product [Rhodiola kirilowii]
MASSSVNIHGQTLEVNFIGGTRLRNTSKVGKQDPFVELNYGGTKHRTKPCKYGGTNPAFDDKFMIKLVEELLQIRISVNSKNTLGKDD